MNVRKTVGSLLVAANFAAVPAAYALDDITVSTVTQLTNALTRLSSYRDIFVSPGTYDLTGAAMSGGSHLYLSVSGHRLVGLGSDPSKTVLKGDGTSHRVLEIVSGSSVSNLTVTGGCTTGHGGGVYNGGIVYNCVICDNLATNSNCNGGGVYGGQVCDSVIRNNKACTCGGGTSNAKLYRCTLTGNSATRGGGANNAGEIVGCSFSGNTATGGWGEAAGGAVYGSGSVTIRDSSFTNNVCNGYAACMNFLTGASGTVVISNCTVFGHTSVYNGAIQRRVGYPCRFEVFDCSFVSNKTTSGSASGTGLSLFDSGVNAFVTNCVFRDNFTYGHGGGACGGHYVDCLFTNNIARQSSGDNYKQGGAVYAAASLTRCAFIGNRAGEGGAVYGCPAVTNCVFLGNVAETGYVQTGGGAIVLPSHSRLVDCAFTNNSCRGYFGTAKIAKNASDVTVTNCTFFGGSGNQGGSAFGGYSRGDGTVAPEEVEIVGCSFISNKACSAVSLGTGTVVRCRFVGNTARAFDGLAILRGCAFVGNTIADNGGAVAISKSAYSGIYDSSFADNEATGWKYGGAIYCGSATALPIVSNCVFTGRNYCGANRGTIVCQADLVDCTFVNCTNKKGYAVFNSNMRNCFITNNVMRTENTSERLSFDYNDKTDCAYTNIHCVFAANVMTNISLSARKVLINCTFADNRQPSSVNKSFVDGGSGARINCLFAGNRVGDTVRDMTDAFTATNCSFSALGSKTLGQLPGAVNCRMVSRERVRFADGGYRLSLHSRVKSWAYDTPEIRAALGEKDAYGQPRYVGPGLDVGAAESSKDPGLIFVVR